MAPESLYIDSDEEPLQIIHGITPHPKGITGRSITVDTTVPPGNHVPEVDSKPAPAKEVEDDKEPENVAPKKKKKKSKIKKAKPSGFEDNYADAPITPAEFHEEINDIYHPDRSFSDRIERSIQRYRAKRKFDPERKDIFDKYLTIGGIDTGPKMFSGGVDPKNLDDKDAEDIATMAATDVISTYNVTAGKDGTNWIVDFEGVAKCFFSSRVPAQFDITAPNKIEQCTSVVRNFLNYLLYHNVCPEYNDQINAARAVCDLANKELTSILKVSAAFPGDFNVACSTLYGGWYQGLYVGNQEWAQGTESALGMSDSQAKETAMISIAVYCSDEQIAQAAKGPRVVQTEDAGFEVTDIIFAPHQIRQSYAKVIKAGIRPVGKLMARRWVNPHGGNEDGTDDEDDEKADKKEREYEFLLEEDLLQHCFVGMKVQARVRTLDCGVSHIDAVEAIRCSFFLNLDDEALIGWRRPLSTEEAEEVEKEMTGLEDEKIRSHFEEGLVLGDGA
ncbi:MAG: hypothetical protein M1832_005318 [Thelocarpon impressellum]|nr:MAG: hypothetical protein M1832_005318 [Thelocarpon impressellum]